MPSHLHIKISLDSPNSQVTAEAGETWGTPSFGVRKHRAGQSPRVELTLHSMGSYLVTQASWSIYCPPNLMKLLCGFNQPRDKHILSSRLLIQHNRGGNKWSRLQCDLLNGKGECHRDPFVNTPNYVCWDQIPNEATSKKDLFSSLFWGYSPPPWEGLAVTAGGRWIAVPAHMVAEAEDGEYQRSAGFLRFLFIASRTQPSKWSPSPSR